ncbi:MAG: toll/interleukin-1 receptor domain-containing protein [Flexilinea sp.]|nr:toll/interleukin-1 receptor domain-containing protein [Flexilinea sp.]
MAIFRCKMCGGDLEVQEGATSCVCEFCGTRQTLPSNQDENLQGLFNRANVLRIKSEFDKAADIYEKILQIDQSEAEAYWGLILCKYGIEYVEDPATYKRIPTCHRASYDAVTTDEDYKNALKYADTVQREIYETEAAKIDEIQKGILAIAQKESPYDVFICYKETDDSGNRTQDSVIANDIYYQLTHEGFKVFYAAISLEDKLGSEYEPVIFSALNTAKVMLVLGTKPEYFNAVWVKNEWSRFLKLMKKDRSRLMIPCYKDMDPYELPEEFAHLQAQNMGKIGFINDLVRGIQKVIGKNQTQPAAVSVQASPAAPVYTSNVNALLKRGNMALEDGEWEKADDFFEQVLNQDAECAEAYWGKFLAANHQANGQDMQNALIASLPEAKKEELIAFLLDDAHVEMVVQAYEIPGLLPGYRIRNRYKFNNQYHSESQARTKQKESVIASLESDKLLIRVRQYAKGEEKTRYESWEKSVESALDNYVLEAQKADQAQIEKLWNTYIDFVRKKDNDIHNEWQEVSIKREQEYQKYVNEMNSARWKSDFIDAERNFSREHMKGYKVTDILAAQCRDAIGKLDEEFAQKELQAAKRKKTIIILIVILFILVIVGWIVLNQQ